VGLMLYALPSLPAAPLGKNANDASSKKLISYDGFVVRKFKSVVRHDADSNVPPSATTRVVNAEIKPGTGLAEPPPPITPLRSR